MSVNVEKTFHTEAVWPSLDANERALALSQGGPMAGVPFHCQSSSGRCSCPPALADAAVSSTALATISLLAFAG